MPRKSNRIEILDAVRGIAIIAMIVHHTMYDLDQIFGVPVEFLYTPAFAVIRQPFTWAFILLAGISSRFSHNNIRRGVKVLACGMVLTVFTLLVMPDESIYFGILHFMGCAILLFVLLQPLLDKIPPVASLVLWSVLFAVTFTMPDTYFVGIPGLFGFTLPRWLTTTPNLYALGFPDRNFYSADYFPMIPWFFMFLIGTVIGTPIRQKKLPEKFYTAKVPFFAFAGRHTLLLYILHQPIVYGVLYLMFKVILK